MFWGMEEGAGYSVDDWQLMRNLGTFLLQKYDVITPYFYEYFVNIYF